jgi:hypothetical protein
VRIEFPGYLIRLSVSFLQSDRVKNPNLTLEYLPRYSKRRKAIMNEPERIILVEVHEK